MFIFTLEIIMGLALGITLAWLLVKAYTAVMTLIAGFAFVFSKAAISLVLAFILHSVNPLQENQLISYGIWAAICLAVCFIICILPRTNCALDFFCRILVTWFFVKSFTTAGLGLFGIHLQGISRIIVEVGSQLVVTILSGGVLMNTLQKTNLNKFSNGLVVLLDRIISSAVYGLALSVLLISQSPLTIPGWVSVPSVIVFAVVAFIVDHIYISKKL